MASETKLDAFTIKHMRNWIENQFQHDTDEEREAIEAKMHAKFADDAEFWANQSYWNLYQQVA